MKTGKHVSARWVSLALVLGSSSVAIAWNGPGAIATVALSASFKAAKPPKCSKGEIPCVCHGAIWCTYPEVCHKICPDVEGQKPCDEGSVVGMDGLCHAPDTKDSKAKADPTTK